MKKILYCMHVGWNWIKQRPHFLAEELAKQYDITVISDYNYKVKKSNTIEQETLHIKNFYKIPKIDNTRKLYIINVWLRKIYYTYFVKKTKPDYIYLMTPNAINYIPKEYSGKIIYDCMDDMLGFTSDRIKQEQIAADEKKLLERAAVVFVSSKNLMLQLSNRYPTVDSSKYVLVRNGYNGKICTEQKLIKKSHKKYTLCYFGTIAEWINFKYMEDSLKELPNIEYLLIGPLQAGAVVPKNERIKHIGAVAHEKLADAVKEADAFIMPFKVTPLIESVDPVKIYEYINFNKNILCVYYPEVERFDEFVYFYNDYSSYVENIKTMIALNHMKYSMEKRVEFLKENTWENRAEIIYKAIEGMEE